jgi:hypothetical protein
VGTGATHHFPTNGPTCIRARLQEAAEKVTNINLSPAKQFAEKLKRADPRRLKPARDDKK